MRLARDNKRDTNEREIINALQSIGAKVLQLDRFDLLVKYREKIFLIEVKSKNGIFLFEICRNHWGWDRKLELLRHRRHRLSLLIYLSLHSQQSTEQFLPCQEGGILNSFIVTHGKDKLGEILPTFKSWTYGKFSQIIAIK